MQMNCLQVLFINWFNSWLNFIISHQPKQPKPMTTEETSADLLIDEENYVRASTGKRFGNYIIDLIVFYFLIMLLFFILAILYPSAIDNFMLDNSGNEFLLNIFGLLFYALYMGVVEAAFKISEL